MRATRAAFALTLAFAACGRADPAPLVVEPDPVDFGEVVSPDQATRTVTVRNRSGRTLSFLARPRFDCSCFALANLLPTSLAPEESVRVQVLMDSTKTDAKRFRKSLTFVVDDPRHPEVTVSVVGEVVEHRRWSAARIDLGVVDATAVRAPARATVRGGEGFRVTATDAVSSDPRLVVALEPAGEATDVVVSVAEGAAPGAVSAQVRTTLVVEGRGRPPRSFRDSLWVTGTIK